MDDLIKCKIWLKEHLIKSTGPVEEVRREAILKGFSRKVLKQARKELGVKTFHQFDEGKATANWFWYFNDRD
jgi:hypothetical protein